LNFWLPRLVPVTEVAVAAWVAVEVAAVAWVVAAVAAMAAVAAVEVEAMAVVVVEKMRSPRPGTICPSQ
jgi:hypothetical protein